MDCGTYKIISIIELSRKPKRLFRLLAVTIRGQQLAVMKESGKPIKLKP